MEEKLLMANVKSLENLKKEKNIVDIVSFDHNFKYIYTYDAVSLEGRNKMTFEKVKRLLEIEDGTGYSEWEIKEVLNHNNAFKKIIETSKLKKNLTEEDIKDLHAILEDNISVGGVYRNVNIQIPGAAHQPPDNIKVYHRMKRLFNDLEDYKLDLFDEGLLMHANIAKIHPFLDANGRLSRLVLNFYLIKAGYLPISISVDKRVDYFKALEEFKVNKDIEPLKLFVVKEMNLRYKDLIDKLDI